MQKVVDGHETDVRLSVAIVGWTIQDVPPFVDVSIDPAWPAATQNDVDTHEIPPIASWFETWLIVTGVDQVLPL